jgi:uncharacterized caspase-like protein
VSETPDAPRAVPANELVRVIRGEPDEEELAALVAGIIAAASSLASMEPEVVEQPPWSDHARRLGTQPAPGPSTWRWSARR